MKKTTPYLIYFLMGCLCTLHGQQRTDTADEQFLKARNVAFNGDYEKARTSLAQLLKTYPEYTDAAILIAKTHSWDGAHDLARKSLNKITSDHKKRQNADAWLAAINNERFAKNHNIALGLANKALHFMPDNTALLNLREKIIKEIREQQKMYNQLKDESEGETRPNTIGVSSRVEVFDQLFEPMYQTSLAYHRKTEIGVFIPRINYAERFDLTGMQYELDAYPILSKKMHGYFNYGFSGAPIFPKHKAAAELYLELPKAMEVSLGGRFLAFEDRSVKVLTGTVGLYRGNYYLSFRPYLSLPSGTRPGLSGNILARKYRNGALNYWGLNLGYGFDVELNQFIANGQLLAETLLYIESGRVLLEYQFTNSEKSQVYNANIGAVRQEFIFDPGNYFWGISFGIRYQTRF